MADGLEPRACPRQGATRPGDRVAVVVEPDSVILTVHDVLDADAARHLVEAAREAGVGGATVEIDLRELAGHTPEGAEGLIRCRHLAEEWPGGLVYRSGRGAGREALLAAYRADHETA